VTAPYIDITSAKAAFIDHHPDCVKAWVWDIVFPDRISDLRVKPEISSNGVSRNGL
jgi:hypothetical protein